MSLKTTIFDIGHGSSTLIETDTLNILFDLGMDIANGTNPLDYVDKLDYLIISHPHWDHISGLKDMSNDKEPTVLRKNKKIPIEDIEESRDSNDDENVKAAFDKYLDLNKRYTVSTNYETNPTNSSYNGNVTIKIFEPKSTASDLNYYSLTLFIEYNGFKLLLMGDNTISNINELLNNDDFLSISENIDIFLTPHHGRESCYSSDLVSHIKPKITIISDKSDDTDTSAVDKYSKNSSGYEVMINGKKEDRSCLTTRKDGNIIIHIEYENLEIYCGKQD